MGSVAGVTLDRWLPDPAVTTRHRRAAGASPGALWDAAQQLRLRDTHRLGRMVRWRIPGLGDDVTYHDMFRAYPFCVLDEDEHTLISGLCGKIWTLARDYPAIEDAAAFAAWDEPGTVRVAFAHLARPLQDGRAELVSEARVQPVDRHARLRLRAIWAVLGPFERLVAAEPLAIAARRAERRG
ncbi:MAG TPA: hypothetical protein VH418_12005 [Solirubrobacteraceae bacterium]|jgi:hypothetical protein